MSKSALPSEDQRFLDDRVRRLAETPAAEPSSRVVIAVIGRDRPGILAGVTAILAARQANILDVSQTILSGLFTMIMFVDLAGATAPFDALKRELADHGHQQGLSIIVQHEDLFKAMHRV